MGISRVQPVPLKGVNWLEMNKSQQASRSEPGPLHGYSLTTVDPGGVAYLSVLNPLISREPVHEVSAEPNTL